MKKTEMTERIAKLYNEAAERQDVYFENALYDLLLDAGMIDPVQNLKGMNKRIDGYSIEQINPIFSDDGEIIAVKLQVSIMSDLADGSVESDTGWLVCEGCGGAMTLWERDPGDAYVDLMHELWNMSIDRPEPGYATEHVGIYDQYVFPVDTCIYFDRSEDQIAATAVEQELWYKANQIYETFKWSMI